jgi:hypothetical protein
LQARDTDPGLIELFVDGKEDGLPDSGRLDGLGLGVGSVLFMLQRAGWRWETCGSKIVLSEQGLVATSQVEAGGGLIHLATGGTLMTEGRHYWEVELTVDAHAPMVGALRPSLDLSHSHHDSNGAYFIAGNDGALYGNGKCGADGQGAFSQGGRIGVLLDLDAGWLQFYRNGKRCGPGYIEGVTGPLVRAAQLYSLGDKVAVLPGAVAPEGAGGMGGPRPRDDYGST